MRLSEGMSRGGGHLCHSRKRFVGHIPDCSTWLHYCVS